MESSGRIIRTAGVVSVFVLWSACALNPPQATPTGYLADYSEFVPHPERRGALLYRKPGLDLRRYRRVIVDPVELALSPEAVGRRVHPEDLARLGRYLRDALVIALRNRYPVLEEPGPAVLRLRAAITDVVPTQPVLNTAETLLAARALSTANRVLRGADLFVGQIAIETEAIDSETGERLMALVDRKVGDRFSVKRGATTWGHVEKALREWAVEFRLTMDRAHGMASDPPLAGAHGPS